MAAFLFVGLLNYLRKDARVDLRAVGIFTVVKIIGATAGSYYVLSIPVSQVRQAVGIFMLCAIIAIVLLKAIKSEALKKQKSENFAIAAAAFLAVGFYEGAVGGGGGIITRIVLSALLGFSLLAASLADAIMTFFASAASSLIFIASGTVDYSILLSMLLGGVNYSGLKAGASAATSRPSALTLRRRHSSSA